MGKINKRNEKGLVHYRREFKRSGEDSFRKVFTVWTSKLFLVNNIINENPFNTNYFAWIDVSASRVNINKKYFTQFYLPNQIYHFSMNLMRYYGISLPIMGFFMIAHKNIWKKLIPLYEKQLQLSKNSKYAHDEETVLYLIWKDNKDLFCDIKKYKQKIHFIHIGKTGGTTVARYLDLKVGYHTKIKINPNSGIIIWLRNPIKRLVSAFYFAKYLINFDCSKINYTLNLTNNMT